MIEVLKSIVDFLISAVQFIVNTISSVVWLIDSFPRFSTTIQSVLAYCPEQLLAFLELSLALMLLLAVFKLL